MIMTSIIPEHECANEGISWKLTAVTYSQVKHPPSGYYPINRYDPANNRIQGGAMEQSIDKIIVVRAVEDSSFAEVNIVIAREAGDGYACISQSITAVPGSSPVHYAISLGFSKIDDSGNMGG